MENCLKDNLDFIINNKEFDINVVFSNRAVFKGNLDKESISYVKENSIFCHPSISANDQYQLALRSINCSINTVFFTKDIFFKIGGCDENFKVIEDIPLMLKLLKADIKFFYLDSFTFLYRIHSNSVFQSDVKKYIYNNWHFVAYIPVYKKYVYPYITSIEKFEFNYRFFLANLFKKINLLNNINIITRLIDYILIFPAKVINNYNRKRIIKKVTNTFK
jgi:hypothetical protein